MDVLPSNLSASEQAASVPTSPTASTPIVSPCRILALLLAVTLVRGFIYTAVIPPWQVPDEPYHFISALLPNLAADSSPEANWEHVRPEAVSSLVEFRYWELLAYKDSTPDNQELYGRLPLGFQFSETTPPRSFTYYPLSLQLSLARHQGIVFQLYWARFLSILTNMMIVVLAFLVGRLLFGDDPFGLILLPLSIILLPQHTFILSGVNDGNPAEFFASAAILFWVWGVTRGWSWPKLAGLLAFTALAVAAKPIGFFLALAIPVWILFRLGRQKSRLVAIIIALAALGIILGLVLLPTRAQGYITDVWQAGKVTIQNQELELGVSLFVNMIVDLYRGFWANLGWVSLAIHETWVWPLLVLSLLAGAGLVKRLVTHRQDEPPSKEAVLILILCAVISLGAVSADILLTRKSEGQSRYLFGAIIPIMASFVIGWRELVPANWRVEGLAVMTSLLFLFDVVVLLNYAVPFFYPLWH